MICQSGLENFLLYLLLYKYVLFHSLEKYSIKNLVLKVIPLDCQFCLVSNHKLEQKNLFFLKKLYSGIFELEISYIKLSITFINFLYHLKKITY